MRAAILWIGLVLFLAGAVLIFLSGSSGPNAEPTVPSLYGTNQSLWTGMTIIGLIMLITGIVLRLAKKNQSV